MLPAVAHFVLNLDVVLTRCQVRWASILQDICFEDSNSGLVGTVNANFPDYDPPKSRRWEKGALFGLFICCLTLCTRKISLPNKMRIWASGSTSGMCGATGLRWAWERATSGEGIFDLLLMMSLHSMRGGKSKHTGLFTPSTWKPTALLLAISVVPASGKAQGFH